MKHITTDLCIIGGGAGGLSVAAGAVQMGADVVLIEKGKMGGDCLNYGCVPSKAILAAAKQAANTRDADRFGLDTQLMPVDYAKVAAHVQSVIAAIAPNDSEERFRGLGVNVIRDSGKFINPREFTVGNTIIRAKRYVIATGSHAAVPPITGLDNVDYLTNETIFNLTEQPQQLIIIGGGPIGCEMAQAHLLLGTKVSLLEVASIMPRDNAELVNSLKDKLIADGLSLYENSKIIAINKNENGICVTIEKDQQQQTITGSHLLVAAGRIANIDNLDLEKANVKTHPRGITINKQLRTSNRRVYAIGDVAGPYQFTHMAAYHAGIIIRNVLFHLRAKVNYNAVPWTTYTDPELAHVGLSEAEALASNKGARILRWPYTENDRAQAEHATTGMIKVFVNKKGRILGASILGKNAGELLTPWTLAISKQLKIGDMANIIVQYPTLSEISKRVAGSFYTETLFSSKTKFIVRLLNRLIR